MKSVKLYLVVLMGIMAIAHGRDISSIKCMGGDGPNPLVDLTQIKDQDVTVFDLKGRVHEYLLWENKGKVVYRNHLGNLFSLNLQNGKSLPLGSSSIPVSVVKDAEERFVTLSGTPITLDTHLSPPQWQKWAHKNRVKHLYWHQFYGRESLFSVSSSFIRPHQQQIEVYSFSKKGVRPHICNLFSDAGGVFHLGEGHSYPYVFLYRTKKEERCTRLTYFNIQIEAGLAKHPVCRLYQSGQYSTLIPGNVKEVYQFPELMKDNQNMFVVRTDHPEKNLLWDDGVYGCRFYNFGSREPMVLNSRQAILAAWSEEEGLSLIYPRRFEAGEPVVIRPLRNQLVGPIHKHHLALSDDGKTLMILAKLKGTHGSEERNLIRVKLP
ncbi:MAG: hypothetical protein ACKN9V_02940 [Pseudomonadota bacterium]